MRYLSLFSGIEAASVAWLPLGWECAAVAEIEPFPCKVLAHHYPDVPNLGDITKITESNIKELGHIDLVVGGFPCQDLSVAGKRKGLKNEDGSVTRSGLFFQAMRIVRWSGARFVLLENVPGIYSSNGGRDFAAVVGEILGVEFAVPSSGWRNSGVAASERGLFEWATLDAQYFGVAQRRRRMFAIGDFGDWTSREPILFERHSLQGHPAPRREAGKGVTGTIGSRTSGGGGFSTDFECAGGLQPVASTGDISHCLNAGGMGRQDFETETLIAHTLRGSGFDASEDGTGRGTMRLPIAWSEELTASIDIAGTIQRGGAGGRHDGVAVPVMPFDTTQIMSKQNGSNPKPGDPCHPLARGDHAVAAHTFKMRGGCEGGGKGYLGQDEAAFTLSTGVDQYLFAGLPGTQYHSLHDKGIKQGDKNGSSQETNPGTLLRTLRQEVGEETFAKWGLGILDSLQSPEVLRQALHGISIRPATFSRSWVVNCALSRKEDGSGWLLQSLREAGCERCSSQGWKPSEQLARELGAYLSELSQPGAQAARFMRDMWIASEGIGLLQQALHAVQKVGRSVGNQGQPIHSSKARAGAKGAEGLQGAGLHGGVSREGVLQQTRAAGEAWHARDSSTEQVRICHGAVEQTMMVRRLTCEEAEFLQGFPRGYTDIKPNGKPTPDGPRYKALGNSMAVPCMAWIGRRIEEVERIRIAKEMGNAA